jgi:hypothetical protein
VTTAYFLERGKLLAATNTLAGRLDEIRRSTEASEQVKTQIAHNDWTVKEFKTLRRTKLEQLTTASYKLLLASEVDAKFKLEDEKYEITSRNSMIDVHQLSALYFAEFKLATDAVTTAHANLATWLIESRSKQRQLEAITKEEKRKLDALQNAGGVLRGVALAAQKSAHENARMEFLNAKIAYADEYPTFYGPLRNSVDELQTVSTALMTELTTPTIV